MGSKQTAVEWLMESKPTAVEWLIEQWPILEAQLPQKLIEKAKAMEKEQTERAYSEGYNFGKYGE